MNGSTRLAHPILMYVLGLALGVACCGRAPGDADTREEDRASVDRFMRQSAAEKGAVRTPSGLIYTEIRQGPGAPAQDARSVTLQYRASLRDGTIINDFDRQAAPMTVAVQRIIPCWQEGLRRMRVGGASRLVCPPALAYGHRGAAPLVRPGAPLVFELELVAVDRPIPVAGH